MSKVWFVTGSNSGIGLGIAKSALAAGDRVVATGRNMEKLRAAFTDVSPDNLELIPLDVTDAAQAQNAVQGAVERFGRIDVLVNNAGYSLLGNFEEIIRGPAKPFPGEFLWCSKCLEGGFAGSAKERSGHIFNVSSVAGAVGLKHCSAYSATKFAVEGLSAAVATEVEQFGIHVTVIEPGFFRTNLIERGNAKYAKSTIADYAHEGSAEDMWSQYDGKQPGDPFKLGKAVVKIANMEQPMKLFVAGEDALGVITPVLEERLRTMQENAELSQVDSDFGVGSGITKPCCLPLRKIRNWRRYYYDRRDEQDRYAPLLGVHQHCEREPCSRADFARRDISCSGESRADARSGWLPRYHRDDARRLPRYSMDSRGDGC